jgi:hypothetical protein
MQASSLPSKLVVRGGLLTPLVILLPQRHSDCLWSEQWQIAISEVQRQAIYMDPEWVSGPFRLLDSKSRDRLA